MKDENKFLYEKVYEGLKREILAGRFGYNALLPSEKEIGDNFEVDRTTVRKALGLLVEEGLVEKKAGVGTRVVMRQYKPGIQNNFRTIGFLLPKSTKKADRITQPFYSSLFYRVEAECRKKGFSLIYTTLDEDDDLFQVVEAHRLSGVIFVTNVSKRFIRQAVDAKIPSILVNSYDENMGSVLSNNTEGAYKAIRHLMELGHRRIGLIKGMHGYVTCDERFDGCHKAARELGLTFNPADIYEGNWEFDGGYEGARKIFADRGNCPTALFAFNDMTAIGAIQGLTELGMSVPGDVSVVGFDNEYAAAFRHLLPQLTTIDVHLKTLASIAADNIVSRLESGGDCRIKIETPVDLVVGATTRPPAKNR
ncbi:MAG: substrate-binding domain-containing protein [Negativicutes bacterium]|nr:substrate-binding domain-containing protein [Negativicutes bacterium]